ncbi:hypothetical protein HDU76_009552, partial [Blyttiomyces sp. JEL0837]
MSGGGGTNANNQSGPTYFVKPIVSPQPSIILPPHMQGYGPSPPIWMTPSLIQQPYNPYMQQSQITPGNPSNQYLTAAAAASYQQPQSHQQQSNRNFSTQMPSVSSFTVQPMMAVQSGGGNGSQTEFGAVVTAWNNGGQGQQLGQQAGQQPRQFFVAADQVSQGQGSSTLPMTIPQPPNMVQPTFSIPQQPPFWLQQAPLPVPIIQSPYQPPQTQPQPQMMTPVVIPMTAPPQNLNVRVGSYPMVASSSPGGVTTLVDVGKGKSGSSSEGESGKEGKGKRAAGRRRNGKAGKNERRNRNRKTSSGDSDDEGEEDDRDSRDGDAFDDDDDDFDRIYDDEDDDGGTGRRSRDISRRRRSQPPTSRRPRSQSRHDRPDDFDDYMIDPRRFPPRHMRQRTPSLPPPHGHIPHSYQYRPPPRPMWYPDDYPPVPPPQHMMHMVPRRMPPLPPPSMPMPMPMPPPPNPRQPSNHNSESLHRRREYPYDMYVAARREEQQQHQNQMQPPPLIRRIHRPMPPPPPPPPFLMERPPPPRDPYYPGDGYSYGRPPPTRGHGYGERRREWPGERRGEDPEDDEDARDRQDRERARSRAGRG